MELEKHATEIQSSSRREEPPLLKVFPKRVEKGRIIKSRRIPMV